MRYYVYISDTKIDMLLHQVPGSRRKKIQREIGIDWRILAAKQTTELDAEEHRVQRLRALEGYIRENEQIGTLDEPRSWIADELPMAWGPLRNRQDVVWFTGEKSVDAQPVAVGLGGSTSHLIGSPDPERLGLGGSFLPGIEKALSDLGPAAEDIDRAERMTKGPAARRPSLLRSVVQTALMGSVPTERQQLQFLARRLLTDKQTGFGYVEHEDGTEFLVTVGTPLYVALVD